MTADPEYRAYLNVFYEALTGATTAIGDAAPLLVLDRITATAVRACEGHAAALPVLTPLADLASHNDLEAAITEAQGYFATASEFREAIYCARCLGRDAAGTLELITGLAYTRNATLPGNATNLSTDRDSIQSAASFAALWSDTGRLAWTLDLIEFWKRVYGTLYREAHASFNLALTGVVDEVEALRPPAAALQRLNSLRGLGPPLAARSLTRLHELERIFPCTLNDEALRIALAEAPFCPECRFQPDDAAPVEELRRLRRAVERGLSGQQVRLGRRVAARLLQRPAYDGETKLQRFLEVVQASDLAGLSLVLDDDLVSFLDALLADSPGSGVLSELARAYPEVTPSNLDAVLDEMRRLLIEKLAREGTVRLQQVEDAP